MNTSGLNDDNKNWSFQYVHSTLNLKNPGFLKHLADRYSPIVKYKHFYFKNLKILTIVSVLSTGCPKKLPIFKLE